MAIRRERIPSTDPRLARHIHHDDRSRAYAFPTAGLTVVSAKHVRRIPVLDQGDLGSCTGNAGVGCLGTDPFYATAVPLHIPAGVWSPEGIQAAFQAAVKRGEVIVVQGGAELADRTPRYPLDESGAVQLYSDATKADDYPGQYPPTDTGSDGLTVAKVLKTAGEISGYQHTFSLDDALKALTVTPLIVGTNWHEDMFNPDADGRVHPAGAVAGGHEYVADEIDADLGRIWFTNSWGPDWGVTRDGRPGRFYMSFDDFGRLLAADGDVTVFVPLSQPAPVPTPPAPPTPDPTPVPDPGVLAAIIAFLKGLVAQIEALLKSLGA